jgi:hypothetical protein
LLASIGAIALWFLRGTLESWLFDKVLRLIEPPPWSWLIEYGPPVAFAVVAIWLISTTRRGKHPDGVDDFVAMPEATRRAYEELRAVGSVWADAADRFSGSTLGKSREEGTLLYMATALRTMDVPIYGAHLPSRRRELISSDELSRGGFRDSGATFHYHTEKHPRYVDIAVNGKDLSAAIENMKKDSALAR